MNIMQFILVTSFYLVVASCGQQEVVQDDLGKNGNVQVVEDPVVQDSLFKNLVKLTGHSISKDKLKDSIAFLLLPMEATCPACRKKTIDSIDKYIRRLDDRHFVVIAGKGRKSINGFFKQQNKELQMVESKIFLDTIRQASDADLTSTNPNIYYAYDGKVYQKVSCLPSTIKKDLRAFFSGL